jgi:hypothetical protein
MTGPDTWLPHPGGSGEYRVTPTGVEFRTTPTDAIAPPPPLVHPGPAHALGVLWFVTLQHVTQEIPAAERMRVASMIPLAAIDDVLDLIKSLGVALPAPDPTLLAPPTASNDAH